MVKVVGVKFKETGKAYYFDPDNITTEIGDAVIVETARGLEYGTVSMPVKEIEESEIVSPLKKIIRIATESDKQQLEKNKKKERYLLISIKSRFKNCLTAMPKHALFVTEL